MEIEIQGHKAKIETVTGQVKDDLFRKEDELVVWLALDEAVAGVLSFPISLPAKKYERDEFLYNVRRRGEEVLERILERDEKEEKERRERHERQKVLDALAAEAQELID